MSGHDGAGGMLYREIIVIVKRIVHGIPEFREFRSSRSSRVHPPPSLRQDLISIDFQFPNAIHRFLIAAFKPGALAQRFAI